MNRSLIIAFCIPLLASAEVKTDSPGPEDGLPPNASAPQPPTLPTSPSVPPPPSVSPPPPNPPATPPKSPATQVESPPASPKKPATAGDAASIPQAYPRARYEESWKKNPFLLKVAVIAQVKESWAMDFALTSISKLSGTYRVGIKNKKTGERKRLSEDSVGDGEFKIVAVNFQADRKSSSVDVEKGGEKATLTYDETMSAPQPRGAVPGQPGMARPGMPVIPGQPGSNVPLPNARTSSAGRQIGGQSNVSGQNTSYPQPSRVAGNTSGFPGNTGGYYGGGAGTGSGTANGTAVGNPGNTTTSRLGALGPRTVASGTGQNSLVPTIGTTYTNGTTETNGTTYTNGTAGATGTSTVQTADNVFIDTTTDSTGAIPDTTTGSTSTVTRRRTLIPAPVVTQ